MTFHPLVYKGAIYSFLNVLLVTCIVFVLYYPCSLYLPNSNLNIIHILEVLNKYFSWKPG